jgi:hypothetical protein
MWRSQVCGFLLVSGYVKGMCGRGIEELVIVVYVMNECGE